MQQIGFFTYGHPITDQNITSSRISIPERGYDTWRGDSDYFPAALSLVAGTGGAVNWCFISCSC